MLFAALFFSYFRLGAENLHWPTDPAPNIALPLIMLTILLVSSATLEWGRRQAKVNRDPPARVAVGVTVVLGLVFVALQASEFRKHLKMLLPTTDAYGSIFYTITSVHGAHLVLGLLMLAYVMTLPKLGPGANRSPHRPLHAVSLYWHFVDGTWALIVVFLYLFPHFARGRQLG
jgi:heme/copper-type cytochrome/quinol oxidase subunit 3